MLDNLTRRLGTIFGGLRRKGRLTESDVQEMLREVRVALLEADVNFGVAKEFIAAIREKAVGEDVFGSLTADQTIIRLVRDELIELLGTSPEKFRWSSSPPTVVLLCGLQGSGKTTTAAKLAKLLAKQGKKAMLAACDVQRPAAVKQLQVLGESIGVPVYTGEAGSTPTQIAKQAIDRCRHLMLDVLIVDTAGRLQIDSDLMRELQDVHKATSPDEVLLVLDATTGQEAVNVAQSFHETVSVTGAIFTKLDGDTRGGAVLSVRAATGVPVRFIGIGEQVDALDTFHPDRMAERILGMGDILGIIEAAEEAIDKDEAKLLESKVRGGNLDFNDLLSQFRMIKRMGSGGIMNILKKLPGIGSQLPEGALEKVNEGEIGKIEAIILSMTPKERGNPDVLNSSRRKRLAAGSGTSVEQVNQLVKQLYEMRKNMKMISKMRKPKKRR